MELESAAPSHSLAKQKDSPSSDSSFLFSDSNSFPISPLNFGNESGFYNRPLIQHFQPPLFDPLQPRPQNSLRKPPLMKKPPFTCPTLALKENSQMILETQKKDGQSNQSTDNSVEIARNSIESNIIPNTSNTNRESEITMNKPKLVLKNPGPAQSKMNFTLKNKGQEVVGFGNPILRPKSNFNAVDSKFKEFFESPDSVMSQKYNYKEKKTSDNSFFQREFEKLSALGKGNFSSVFECRHKATGIIYAIKVTKNSIKTVKSSGQILNEAQLLAFFTSSGHHPNIVKYYSSWFEDKELFIQMEFCDTSLETLAKNKKTFSERELTKILKDICSGLQSLHRNNVVHLDIKPDNILYSKDQKLFKIADLGLSRVSTIGKGEDILEGDSRYLAQELLNLNSNDANDLTKADIFSLGASIYELMTKESLPKSGDDWQAIRKGNFDKLDQSNNFSKNFKDLIKNMMHPNFQLRPRAQDILRFVNFLSDEEKELRWLRMKAKSLREERKNMEVMLKTEERRLKRRLSF